MRSSIAKVVVAAGVFLSCPAAFGQPMQKEMHQADLVITGADIYTVDDCRRWAHGIAVRDGKILYVGENEGTLSFAGPATRKIELHGEMILPGFHDSHVHPIDSGIELALCRLEDATSKAEILRTIEKYSKAHPKDAWVIGGGWSLPLFPNACPLKEDLDAIIPDRPAFFESQDAHSAWANSAALKLAGITKETVDPPLGIIERDANGEPSGTLREYATELVSKLLPKFSKEERLAGLRRTLGLANGFGITSMQDASADEQSLETYKELADAGQLTSRVVAALHVNPAKDADQVIDFVALRTKYSSPYLRPTSAKIFADGVVETHTAALCEPYTDKPGNSGMLNFKTDELNHVVEALDKHGFQVHVHAIGDQAVNQALNALESALSKNGPSDNRHHIAHLELIKPTDIPRFRKLNVVANFQPFWAYRDAYITHCTEPLLGAERTNRLYQIGSLMKSGAIVAAGSDWSVTTLNPLDAIQVAVTRKGLADKTGASWTPDEKVTLPEIISAYTINGAFVNHQEKITGSIEKGKDADFIVLNKNLFEIDPSEIHKTKVLMTFFKGNPVYTDKMILGDKSAQRGGP